MFSRGTGPWGWAPFTGWSSSGDGAPSTSSHSSAGGGGQHVGTAGSQARPGCQWRVLSSVGGRPGGQGLGLANHQPHLPSTVSPGGWRLTESPGPGWERLGVGEGLRSDPHPTRPPCGLHQSPLPSRSLSGSWWELGGPLPAAVVAQEDGEGTWPLQPDLGEGKVWGPRPLQHQPLGLRILPESVTPASHTFAPWCS